MRKICVAFLIIFLSSFSKIILAQCGMTFSTSYIYSTCSQPNGQATVVVSGGIAPYAYSWTPAGGTNATATGLISGIYTMIVTDNTSCIQNVSVVIPNAAAPNLTLEVQQACPINGSIISHSTGGTAPFTYSWAPNFAITSSLTGLSPGSYTLTMTDASGCSASASATIVSGPAINMSSSVINPSCTDGSINLTLSNGTPPFNYQWSDHSTSQNISSLTTGGLYSVLVTDLIGCTVSQNFVLPPPSPGPTCSFVQGKVFTDWDRDCIFNNSDQPLSGQLVTATPGPYYATTDNQGNYTLILPFDTFAISSSIPAGGFAECPVNSSTVITSSINNLIQNQNFSDTAGLIYNLKVWHTCPAMRPGGMQYPFALQYSNIGWTPMNGIVWFKTDDTLIFLHSNPAPSYISNDTLYWNFSNLAVNQTNTIYIYDSIPALTGLLGHYVCSASGILPVTFDVQPSNNIYYCCRYITASYDPNLKEVSPKGIGPQGYITDADSILTYTIHFLNTGTDTAFVIIVRDTLSSHLDMSTVESGPASDPYTFNIYGTGILKWTFNNILLPDSNVNEPRSHGYVEFRVKQKANLSPGTVISNNAGIYFDYNPPVITNTVVNTISTLTEINNIVKLDNNVIAYPDPFVSEIGFEYEMKKAGRVSISIFDLLGNKVFNSEEDHSSAGKYKSLFDFGFLPSGIYIVQFKMNDRDHFVKIIKQ